VVRRHNAAVAGRQAAARRHHEVGGVAHGNGKVLGPTRACTRHGMSRQLLILTPVHGTSGVKAPRYYG
jgi:hypothetical protein